MQMKRTLLFRLLLPVLAAVLVCCAAFAEEEAAKKEKGVIAEKPDAFFSWYYSTGSLPAGCETVENSLRISGIYSEKVLKSKTPAPEPEKVILVSVDWKEGDESLSGAVIAAVDGNGAKISLEPSAMKQAGSAVFTLVLESEHYRLETEKTLIVLDPAKTPSFTQTVFNPVFNVVPGSSFTAQNLLNGIASIDYAAFCQERKLPYPDAEVSVEEAETPGLVRNERTGVFTLEEYGVFDLNLKLRIANLRWTLPFRIESEPYSIKGPGFIMPGGQAKYRVTDEDAAAGRRYSWRVEGEGAEIGAQDGILTLSADTRGGQYIKVLLTPDTAPEISMSVLVPEGALPKDLYVLHEAEHGKGKEETEAAAMPLTEKEAGFAVAVPEGTGWKTNISPKRQGGWMFRCIGTGTGGATVVVDVRTDQIYTGFREDDLAALNYYNDNAFPDTVTNLQTKDIRIDGHLAREYLFTATDQTGQATHYGQISYCRNNQCLTARIYTFRQGTDGSGVIPVTMQDLDRIAGEIRYEPDEGTIRMEDAQLTVSPRNGNDVITAGESCALTVEFANPKLISAAKKNNGLIWQVKDAETGKLTDAATVNASSVLIVKKDLERFTQLEVTAISDQFGTSASCTIKATPAAEEVIVEPEMIWWYKKGDNPVYTVKASVKPADIPLSLLTWKVYDEKKLELTMKGDGEAELKVLEGGDNSVTVEGPGKKKALVRIRAVTPVEEITLKAKGEPKPGGKVSYKVTFKPQSNVRKGLSWSLDVDSGIAEIDEDGTVRISPDAQPGTEITVTCTAHGALEPVTATDKLTVQ